MLANRALIKQIDQLGYEDLQSIADLVAVQIAETITSDDTAPATPAEIATAVSAALLPALSEIPEDTVSALGERLG